MQEFDLSILASDKSFFEGKCYSLTVPTVTGQLGILANHSNLISAVCAGTLTFSYRDTNGQEHQEITAVSQGIVKIEKNSVLVLVDSIERPEEIDANRAMRAMEEAKEVINKHQSIRAYYDAQTRMARALNRLKVKRNYKR